MDINKALEELSRDQLIELMKLYSKDLIALDGVWFQSLEQKCGMDVAMEHDTQAWKRFSVSEGKRLKGFLNLPEQAGLDGLERALGLRLNTLACKTDVKREENTLTFKVLDCRVQTARKRKQMPFHPCKSVGLVEYSGFASALDNRITCECVSCYPDITDETCSCSWKYTLDSESAEESIL